MIYQTPADPHKVVWDKNGRKWSPDDKPGSYGWTVDVNRKVLTWPDLVANHGPLTDCRVPEVGETFTVTDNGEISADDVPRGAVFASDYVSVFCTGEFFEFSGDTGFSAFLSLGKWTRLR